MRKIGEVPANRLDAARALADGHGGAGLPRRRSRGVPAMDGPQSDRLQGRRGSSRWRCAGGARRARGRARRTRLHRHPDRGEGLGRIVGMEGIRMPGSACPADPVGLIGGRSAGDSAPGEDHRQGLTPMSWSHLGPEAAEDPVVVVLLRRDHEHHAGDAVSARRRATVAVLSRLRALLPFASAGNGHGS